MAKPTQRFELKKGDHTVTTTVPAEAVQLRAIGYRDADSAPPGPVTVQSRTGAPEIVTRQPDTDQN